MEKKVKDFLEVSRYESEAVSQIVVPPQEPGNSSFYEDFARSGLRVDRVGPHGLLVCTLKVPHRLTDRAGNLAKGAIANLVDVVGGCVIYVQGKMKLHTDVNQCEI
uniref:uncharacterized protein LOC101295502 n=1 Tax=Fragaria vesca subsp. vesca TaxID=101020 RepID=UPI0005C7F0CA|nr:PREDICTED: uncharacterized protein LOC101295502 [Fragaria vesca subsp. vesca]